MLSHSPLSGPYPGNTTCSFAVSSICSVSERCGFRQSYCIPHAPHHHPLMMFSFFLSPRLVPTHRKKSVFSWEQLVVLTYVCERDSSPSFLFGRNVPQSIGVFPLSALRIRVACLDVFQHLLPNSFDRPPCPTWHIFRLQFTVSAHVSKPRDEFLWTASIQLCTFTVPSSTGSGTICASRCLLLYNILDILFV